MHITNVLKKTWVCTVLLTGLTATQGQTVFTAVYIGPSSGGDWNTAGNWSTAVVPGADPNGTTNAVILGATNVNYNSAMVAGNGFGVLTNQGTLNVNAVGFTNTGIVMTFTNAGSSGKLFVNNGGAVKVNGNLGLCSNSIVSMAAGSSITISGALWVAVAELPQWVHVEASQM
jgi:hypothetical protein